MKKFILFIGLFILTTVSIAQSKYQWKTATGNGYTYKYVQNDPTNTRFYTLKNGLSVILSPNHKEPSVVYRMCVRAGSNTDPKDHTGLAHYLEHLLFKGTDKYGTQDWEKEEPYIDTIYALYEKYNATTDTAIRRTIYKEIDRVSGIASRYSISGEYMKLMADIGSQRTNAHTGAEETVYEEEFPANAIDKFLMVQAERFRNPVFRLFHTELEAVYEEKNRSLDNDGFKIFETMNAALFPTHNYGQQTTIGTIEHLKSPSLVAIRDYYKKYYVPNNMGLILVGDLDPDAVIKKVDQYFSYMKSKPVDLYNPVPETPLTTTVERTIFGNSAEMMRLAYRLPGAKMKDALALELMTQVLFNSKVGMFDINLNKQQKALNATAGLTQYKDYSVLTLSAYPKPGQTLEQLKQLLLEQVAKLKNGEFDDNLMAAILANKKLGFYTNLENSTYRALGLMDAFTKNRGEKWDMDLSEIDDMSKLTKQDIINAANSYLGNGYVQINKRRGEDKNNVKVQKPSITPVATNANKQSSFYKAIEAKDVEPATPQWLDFSKDFQRGKAGIATIYYVHNKENGKFRLHYRFDMGSRNNLLLPLAAQYIQYLGTDKYTAEQISKEFYNIGCSFNINSQADATGINLTGLDENFDKAVALLEHVLANCVPSESALNGLKGRLMRQRNDAKTNKSSILQGLAVYARYGVSNPFNHVLSNDDIQNLDPNELVNLLHGLLNYKHDIIYYGPMALKALQKQMNEKHKLPASFTSYPAKKTFTPLTQTSNKVLFADFDMVQAEINWIRNGEAYHVSKEPLVNVFNSYFGQGGSSLVFQTIRESKALAYSTNASYSIPFRKEDPFFFSAYIGCQADKLSEAIKGMNELLTSLPTDQKSFERAVAKRKRSIEMDRMDGPDCIFSYINAKHMDIDYDKRKVEYNSLDKLKMEDLVRFHKENLSGKAFTYCIVGPEGKIKIDELKKYGELTTLSLDEIFGY